MNNFLSLSAKICLINVHPVPIRTIVMKSTAPFNLFIQNGWVNLGISTNRVVVLTNALHNTKSPMLRCVRLPYRCNGNLSSGTWATMISRTPKHSWYNGCGKQYAYEKCKGLDLGSMHRKSIDFTYVLFFSKNSQNRPDKKNISDIMKYSSGKGISPAERKLFLFASSMSICRLAMSSVHYCTT